MGFLLTGKFKNIQNIGVHSSMVFMGETFPFTSFSGYPAWKTQWVADYQEISSTIRKLKAKMIFDFQTTGTTRDGKLLRSHQYKASHMLEIRRISKLLVNSLYRDQTKIKI
jgi:hypothetical protein